MTTEQIKTLSINDKLMRVATESERLSALREALKSAALLSNRIARSGDVESCALLGRIRRVLDSIEDEVLQKDAGRVPETRLG